MRTIENGRGAFPGETPAGIVFEAVATKDGVETKARTRAWQGRVASATPPTLQGEAAVGKPVTTAQGTWSGGWGSSPGSTNSVFACREPAGSDCWLISYGPSAVPDPRWAGWYLFAQEYLSTGNAVCNAILGCSVNAVLPASPFPSALRRSATVERSAPLGPIVGAPERTRISHGPLASIRTRALRRNGRLLVGRVSCESCSVRLKVSGGKRRAHYETLRVTGVKALTVPVRHGKLKVRVVVDGKLLTSGPTTAR